MKMDGNAVTRATNANYAPFFVVNPGETILTAMERHRRDTGHRGSWILVAINRATPRDVQARCQGHAAAAELAVA